MRNRCCRIRPVGLTRRGLAHECVIAEREWLVAMLNVECFWGFDGIQCSWGFDQMCWVVGIRCAHDQQLGWRSVGGEAVTASSGPQSAKRGNQSCVRARFRHMIWGISGFLFKLRLDGVGDDLIVVSLRSVGRQHRPSESYCALCTRNIEA